MRRHPRHPRVALATPTIAPVTTTASDLPARSPAPPNRLPSLTGLRWIGAMLVFGFHVGTMHVAADPEHARVIRWLFTLGLSGVQFFFILSGFVLVWSARPGDTPTLFWRRRMAKIYPNHVLMWAVVVGYCAYQAIPQNPQVLLANLFLVQAWIPTGGYFYSVNTVSWSLSCEMFFYLCLPLVLPLIRRMRVWALWAMLVAAPVVILSLGPVHALLGQPDQGWWFTQVFPLSRSLEFWMGVAAAELMLRGRWRGPGLGTSTALFVAAWVVATAWIPATYWTALLAVVYVLVIAAAARADIHGLRSPWRGRVMVWLGEVSFAFYLIHVFVVLTILRETGYPRGLSGWRGPAAALGFLLLNLALAGLLFHFVEKPMTRLLGTRRRVDALPPPPGPPAAPGPTGAGVRGHTPARRPSLRDRSGASVGGTISHPTGERAALRVWTATSTDPRT